jgi:hypothetical protein
MPKPPVSLAASAAGNVVWGCGGTAEVAGVDCEAQERVDSGGLRFGLVAPKGISILGVQGCAEEFGGAGGGGGMGLRPGATGRRGAVRQICGREREEVEQGVGVGAEAVAGGAVESHSQSESLHSQSRFRDMQQISRGKFDRLPRTTAGFTTSAFDGCGLRDQLLARPAP